MYQLINTIDLYVSGALHCRVFTELTKPLERVLSVDEVKQTVEGQKTIKELEQHLSDIKDIFLDKRLTKVIIEYVENTLTEVY